MSVNVYTTQILRIKRDLAEKEFLYVSNPNDISKAEKYRIASNNFNGLWSSIKTKNVPYRVEVEYNKIINMLNEGLAYLDSGSVLTTACSIKVLIDESELKSLLRLLKEGHFVCEVFAKYPIGELLTEYDLDVSM